MLNLSGSSGSMMHADTGKQKKNNSLMMRADVISSITKREDGHTQARQTSNSIHTQYPG